MKLRNSKPHIPWGVPTVHFVGKRAVAMVIVLSLGMAIWGLHHFISIKNEVEGSGDNLAILWTFVWLYLFIHLVASWCERPKRATLKQHIQLDGLFVTLNVPLFNEEERILALVCEALLKQTRRINRIQIVDDGSHHNGVPIDYSTILDPFVTRAKAMGIDASWVRIENQGKRHAQLTTFETDKQADIFVTVDSDSVLEPNAIREGLIPFLDQKVSSVAGVILAQNSAASWFTRVTDAWLLAFQLCTRSALSRVNSVLVNSGNFALYQAQIVREAAASYGNETFLGRPMQYSDDSLLTLFSYMKGKTVQQETAIAFTVLPENPHHHIRQQLRWMRGSFIRSWWRARYLPVWSLAYWENFLAWLNFVLVSEVFAYLFLWWPIVDHRLFPLQFFYAAFVALATAAKYMVIRRSDQTFWYQLGTYLLTPLMLIWVAFVLRPLRIYAMFTAYKTGWGTRSTIEVELSDKATG